MKQLYKDEVCPNCINEECTNNIKEEQYEEVIQDKISITTVMKCTDFICAKKRKKVPRNRQRW